MNPIPIFYDPGFAAPIGDHVMPIQKFALVAEALADEAGFEMRSPAPAGEADLLRVHSAGYIDAIRTGEPRSLAESQKFPWSPELFPSVCLTNGAVYEAALAALGAGIAGALASGFHHSCHDHGEGFCTFNGLVVALERLRSEGKIRTAAVLDLDLHYGNGTASLSESRSWLNAVSVYGNDYWENVPYADVSIVRHPRGPNHTERALPNGCRGAELIDALDAMLPSLIEGGSPDILLYQAGADPLRDDPYSPLDLGPEDLMTRDQRVFEFCRDHGIPVAWVLAGGYTKDVRRVVAVHVNTALAARAVYRCSVD